MYHGVRDEPDVYLENELSELSASYPQVWIHTVLSEAAHETSRRTGFVHTAFDRDFTLLPEASLYTAGPPKMVDAVKAVGAAKGIKPEKIHSDSFFLEPVSLTGREGECQRTVGESVFVSGMNASVSKLKQAGSASRVLLEFNAPMLRSQQQPSPLRFRRRTQRAHRESSLHRQTASHLTAPRMACLTVLSSGSSASGELERF